MNYYSSVKRDVEYDKGLCCGLCLICPSSIHFQFPHIFLFIGIERDAVNIFTKYISPDAARPIPITEQIRNDIVGKRVSLSQ